MTTFRAIGYHSTDSATNILKRGINVNIPSNDVFLGRGFYLWRDSYSRAKKWKVNEYKDKLEVLEASVSCRQDEMLNFTSINWNKELDTIKLYLKYFKLKNIYFGEYLDFLIDELQVGIKLIVIMDLKNRVTKLHIQDSHNPNAKSIFSYGDVQMCIKHIDIIENEIKKITYES